MKFFCLFTHWASHRDASVRRGGEQNAALVEQKSATQAFSWGLNQRKATISLISRRSWVHIINMFITWLILRIRACQQQSIKPWILLVV
nr:MAG TPA: hypothetical protein [Caudoviricetes sp.]